MKHCAKWESVVEMSAAAGVNTTRHLIPALVLKNKFVAGIKKGSPDPKPPAFYKSTSVGDQFTMIYPLEDTDGITRHYKTRVLIYSIKDGVQTQLIPEDVNVAGLDGETSVIITYADPDAKIKYGKEYVTLDDLFDLGFIPSIQSGGRRRSTRRQRKNRRKSRRHRRSHK